MPIITTENIHPFNRYYTFLVLISVVSIFAIWSRYLSAQYEQSKGILDEMKRVESRLKFNVRNRNLRMTISQEKEVLTTTEYGSEMDRFEHKDAYKAISTDYHDGLKDDNSNEKDNDENQEVLVTTEHGGKHEHKEAYEAITADYYDDVEDDYSDEDDNNENIDPTTMELNNISTTVLTTTDVINPTTISDIEDDIVEPITTELRITTAIEPQSEKLKYIFIYTRAHFDPLMHLGEGQAIFIKKRCPVQNCHISLNKKKLLKDLTEFDVILFNGPDILNKKKPVLPERRDPKQNYVFASIESSDYYPMCDDRFEGYFNITWTYKLNSDVSYGYMIARNKDGEIVAPKQETHWISIDNMKHINETVKEKLSTKKKLASWMVSNCRSPSGRDQFVKKIQDHLKTLDGNWTVDIYGKCGTIQCERKDMPKCLSIFETDYYFYFAFENSFAEDYVTEKVLHPLQHNTVPVVYGAANYTRFLPAGIYLNAFELGPEKVAEKMVEVAENKEKYYEYFKWHNHYTFHYMEESPDTDFHCLFCAAMNNEELINRNTSKDNFKNWWNPPKIRRGGCPPRY